MPDTGLLERPQLATQQLLTGNVGGAWEALLAPQNLSVHEHDEYLTKLGIKDTPYESIFKSLTNPLLIVSLILSHKFPPAIGDALLKVSDKVGGLTTKTPFFGKWMSKEAWFRGTEIPGLLDDVSIEVMDFKKRYGIRLGEVLTNFKGATGHLPTEKEQILVSSWLDGLNKPLRGFTGKNGRIRVGSGITQMELPEVGVLMPNLEQHMSPELLGFAKDTRNVLNEVWDEVFSKPENRKQLLKALSKQKAAGLWDDSTQFVQEYLQNPRKIVDYFPRRLLQTPEDFQRLVQMMTAGGSSKRYAGAAAAKAEAWVSDEVRKRNFATLPSWTDLNVVKDALDPAALSRLETLSKAKMLAAAKNAGVRDSIITKLQKLEYSDLANNYPKYLNTQEAALFGGAIADTAPRQYSLRLMPVLSSYTHTLAGTYGWTVKGYGEKLREQLTLLKDLAKAGSPYAKARADVFENTLLPLAMGRQTFQRAIKSQAWQQGMASLSAHLDTPALKNLLGGDTIKSLQEHVVNSKGALNLLGLQQKTSAYFYLSTLGLNPASAMRNLFQMVLTLGPTVGWTTAAEALGNVMKQGHKYFALRLGDRVLSHEAAIAKVFPDFAKAGLAAGHITEEVVDQALRSAYNVAQVPSMVTTVGEKISRAMMSMFTASETVNRLASFEAGMIHARRAGLHIDAAIPFARDIVRKTQFVLTPTSGPIALANYGPLMKQFMYFPARMLEFATSTAFTLGSGAIDPRTGKEMNILGYNPGTAARMVAGSIIAMEMGDAMGLDFRSGLLESSLPMLQPVKSGSPFGALPVVPPAVGLVGSALYGATTGEWDSFKHTFPMLVPGGILTARGAGFIPPEVGGEVGPQIAQALDRTYADYKQPAPDGRIAVYSGKGTFRGYYTPWDLIKSGLGIRGGDLDKEQQVLTTITKNRDSITESKRDYLDARFRNSAREANAVAAQFKQKFGFDLPVTDQDIKAMQTRRHITRLEQLIRTAPPGPARESLMSAVQATLGTNADAMMGVDPALLGGPRPQVEKSRFGSGKVSGSSLPRFDSRSDLGPQDQVNPQKIGRQPGVSQGQSPF
jgi:hypothetical protein